MIRLMIAMAVVVAALAAGVVGALAAVVAGVGAGWALTAGAGVVGWLAAAEMDRIESASRWRRGRR